MLGLATGDDATREGLRPRRAASGCEECYNHGLEMLEPMTHGVVTGRLAVGLLKLASILFATIVLVFARTNVHCCYHRLGFDGTSTLFCYHRLTIVLVFARTSVLFC